jgi:hypothetical protein
MKIKYVQFISYSMFRILPIQNSTQVTMSQKKDTHEHFTNLSFIIQVVKMVKMNMFIYRLKRTDWLYHKVKSNLHKIVVNK